MGQNFSRKRDYRHEFFHLVKSCQDDEVQKIEEFYQEHEIHLQSKDNPLLSFCLNEVISSKKPNIAQFLVSKGARADYVKKNGDSFLIMAVKNGFLEMVKILTASINLRTLNHFNDEGKTALMIAAAMEDSTILQEILKFKDLEVNEKRLYVQGDTALMISARLGLSENVEILLNAGANALVQNNNGSTALHLAAKRGDEKIVKLILAHHEKSAIIADSNGFYPLMYAAKFGQESVVKLLLPHSEAIINETSKNGKSALVYAALTYKMPICSALLAAGAFGHSHSQEPRLKMSYAERAIYWNMCSDARSHNRKMGIKDDLGVFNDKSVI